MCVVCARGVLLMGQVCMFLSGVLEAAAAGGQVSDKLLV